jgi:hypothetical protein
MTDSTRYTELKARFAADGYELFIDDGSIHEPASAGPRYYVRDPKIDRIVVVDTEEGIADWFKDRPGKEEHADSAAPENSAEERQWPKYTLLLNPANEPGALNDTIYAVRALGRAIEQADDAQTIHGLAGAVVVIGERLELALGNVDSKDEAIINAALRTRGAA